MHYLSCLEIIGYKDLFLTDIFYVDDLHSILFEKDSLLPIWKQLQIHPQDEQAKTLLTEGRGHISSVLLSENEKFIQVMLFGGESFMKRHDNFFILKIDKM